MEIMSMEPKTKTRAAVDVAVAFVVLPFLLITPVVVIIFLFVKYYLFKCRDISKQLAVIVARCYP